MTGFAVGSTRSRMTRCRREADLSSTKEPSWPSAKAVDENSGRKASVRHRRQGCSNALREIGRAIGCLRGLVNQRATPQLVKWQRCIDPARIIEVTIDQAVEQMPDVEAAGPAGGVRVT